MISEPTAWVEIVPGVFVRRLVNGNWDVSTGSGGTDPDDGGYTEDTRAERTYANVLTMLGTLCPDTSAADIAAATGVAYFSLDNLPDPGSWAQYTKTDTYTAKQIDGAFVVVNTDGSTGSSDDGWIVRDSNDILYAVDTGDFAEQYEIVP